MKAEFLSFSQYAFELRQTIQDVFTPTSFLTESDVLRCERSIAGKAHGFIADCDSLCGDIRLALSTGNFQMSDHTKCVFRRMPGSVLPKFLWGALRQVFECDGSIRDDMCPSMASAVIRFLSPLKRIDPPSSAVKELSEKVWSTLKDCFGQRTTVCTNIVSLAEHDVSFRSALFKIKSHFRKLVDVPIVPSFAYGPGANRERYSPISNMDWYVPVEQNPTGVPSKLIDSLKNWSSYDPRPAPYKGWKVCVPCGLPIDTMDTSMTCNSVPKSYKAYRGVGTMSAGRMALQLMLQRSFYRFGLTPNLPLNDQEAMKENIRDNWDLISTIDLSSASDRLYWDVLYFLGNGVPFFDACFALRTRTLKLPTEEIECSSPVMGEAITFPLMSCFFAAVALAVCDEYGWGHELVRVYGDDVQTSHYERTCQLLTQLGAKVSVEKSYPAHSLFKESCEGHYVQGPSGSLRNARPCYFPVWSINVHKQLMYAVDAFKWLTFAKDSFLRDGPAASAACALVEKWRRIKLFPIPFNSPFLGRPTLHRSTTAHMQLKMTDDSNTLLSQRAVLRSLLRSPEHAPNAKVHSKTMYKIITRRVGGFKLYMEDLSTSVLLLLVRHCCPAEFEGRCPVVNPTTPEFSNWVVENLYNNHRLFTALRRFNNAASSARKRGVGLDYEFLSQLVGAL